LSEAFEAARQVFHDADQSPVMREIYRQTNLLQLRDLRSVTRFACALPQLQGLPAPLMARAFF
jgi:hypothetical protein